MLSIDKVKFFTERQLPKVKYCYTYTGENYEVLLEEVIRSIGESEEKCLFLLNEFNASNEFLVNVYLQDLAEERLRILLRNNLYDKISASLLDENESYKFKINENEYIAYRDAEGKYHANKADDIGKFAGNSRYSNFETRLFGLLDMHNFDFERVDILIVS